MLARSHSRGRPESLGSLKGGWQPHWDSDPDGVDWAVPALLRPCVSGKTRAVTGLLGGGLQPGAPMSHPTATLAAYRRGHLNPRLVPLWGLCSHHGKVQDKLAAEFHPEGFLSHLPPLFRRVPAALATQKWTAASSRVWELQGLHEAQAGPFRNR